MLAYTIVTRAYIAHARVLAKSYALQHPGRKLWALLIDDVDDEFSEESEPFRILRLRDLNLDLSEIHRMGLLFANKLIAVIKPWVFEHFLNEGAESVLYIDGDVCIYQSLDSIAQAAGNGVILVPHLLQPLPRDGCDPDETALMGAGMFNAGMFGVGPGHGGFIGFLQDRLRRECIFDAPRMRFNEQRWLDFVPSLFPHYIVRDPGVDVAYWNLHERTLENRDDGWFAGGVPLKAFHFSSYDPRTHGVGGRYELDPAPRVRMADNPSFAELCQSYARELLNNGFSDVHNTPFAFDTLTDGSPVYQSLRTLFTDAVNEADLNGGAYPPDPFEPSERASFQTWYIERYRDLGLPLPRGLADGAGPPPSGVVARIRKKFGTEHARESSQDDDVRWTLDWLDRMIIDDAAERGPAGGIRVRPERVGFVCHGPRAPVESGKYTATLEWDSNLEAATAPASDLVLVVEAFIQGYVVGSRAFSSSEIATGAVILDIEIPDELLREALLFGLELRVLSRGGLDAVLSAVVIRALVSGDRTRNTTPLRVEWLPVMAGGDAGLRQGKEIVSNKDKVGTVVMGPNWRLPAGKYLVDVRTRLSTGSQELDEKTDAIAVIEVRVGGHVLTSLPLTSADVATGESRLEFEISEERAGPTDQVGVQLNTLVPVDLVLTALHLEYLKDARHGTVPVG